jgi:hypothetical protein
MYLRTSEDKITTLNVNEGKCYRKHSEIEADVHVVKYG